MTTSYRFKLCFALSLIFILAACTPTPTAPPKIDLHLCQVAGVAAECGTVSVFEDRAANRGRKIDIHVAVIRASGNQSAPDPIFYFAGGPGGSAIEDAPYVLKVLKTASWERDIVLIDQRGTGKSNNLTCAQPPEFVLEAAPVTEPMVADLRACLDKLDADPAAYTTAWGVDDIDDVRAALGYDKINLYGESYGPTAEQIYLQRHGEHVRSVILEGVSLVGVPMFERMPHGSQQALDQLDARCQADPDCHAAYPNFKDELAAVIERVAAQPVELPLTNPLNGQPVKVTREVLVQSIHGMLISTERAVMLPYLIHQANLENWDAITAAAAPNYSSVPETNWQIMNMTILCHEEWASLRREQTAQLSAGSYLTYEDVRWYTVPEEICAVIPRPKAAALYEPVSGSDVPVLIITNEADPQNPLENVAEASKLYPNSLTLVAPGQGHGYTGILCRDQILADFIDQGTAQGFNTDCLQEVPLPSFLIMD